MIECFNDPVLKLLFLNVVLKPLCECLSEEMILYDLNGRVALSIMLTAKSNRAEAGGWKITELLKLYGNLQI